MNKTIIAIMLSLLINVAAHAQYEPRNLAGELGASLGTMSCNTDIEGKIADPKSFKLSGGVYAALLYRQIAGLRLEATFGSVTADDKRSDKAKLRNRNLNFKSKIAEVSLLAELHPLEFVIRDYTPALSAYVLAGVGYFTFNPQALYNNTWVALQPLHTEGQGFAELDRPNYQLYAFNFSGGGGLRYNLSERLTLRGEAVYRMLSTDYLDDVSTSYVRAALFDKYLPKNVADLAKILADRSSELAGGEPNTQTSRRGNPKNNDAYYSVSIKLGIKLDNFSNKGISKNARKSMGCYRF